MTIAKAKAPIPALIIALGLAVPAGSADADTGFNAAVAASNCYVCHGPAGKSESRIPKLNDMSKSAIADYLKAARAGTQPATIMNRISKGYTEAQIEAIAAYLAAQRNKPY